MHRHHDVNSSSRSWVTWALPRTKRMLAETYRTCRRAWLSFSPWLYERTLTQEHHFLNRGHRHVADVFKATRPPPTPAGGLAWAHICKT